MTGGGDRLAFARGYIEDLCAILEALPLDQVTRLLEVLEEAHREKRQVLLAGNGGSAATASHMANDLAWGTAKEGGHGFQVRSLTDSIASLTAISNDRGYAEVFAAQLATSARAGDVLIVLSASGNSANIVRAVEEARRMGLSTVGILGMNGGRVASMVDIPIIVPSDSYGPVEDVHMVLDHLITAYFQRWQAAAR